MLVPMLREQQLPALPMPSPARRVCVTWTGLGLGLSAGLSCCVLAWLVGYALLG